MKNRPTLKISQIDGALSLKFSGEMTVYNLSKNQESIDKIDLSKLKHVDIDLYDVTFVDTAAALFVKRVEKHFITNSCQTQLLCDNNEILRTLALVEKKQEPLREHKRHSKKNIVEQLGKAVYKHYRAFLSFISFLGELFSANMRYFRSGKNIRYKEIAFEIYESGIKALGIIALTSFLIGVVVAYQSAYQLKIYGANIFIVDMLGLSILRELAPMMTAIVIAGRSGSAFTAQIGAMKITEELDAMRTMGFDPYMFLVLPRIIALMIALPILIFVADIAGVLGGMLIAYIDLKITVELFIERFSDVIAVKHFYIGIFKGPFFAFLIASIAIYRGLMVQNDTQSIGFNTTKSVVEAIFAVIICDALFSIAFTNLGI
ncbi:MAG: MlaE family lipid ABC transporter permease subunit [Sulfurimonas sp.]|nr:MlaE family lipid ABC transporter permease subunit [Sulfurimonas sp.]MDD3060103.1 MlaE family lipid ABC transporter permease subunit [Sulfurimonas sp.]MDD5203560.1 MlaE family lipid ABC transporter permease subunit [Sulfurimonas sp.]